MFVVSDLWSTTEARQTYRMDCMTGMPYLEGSTAGMLLPVLLRLLLSLP